MKKIYALAGVLALCLAGVSCVREFDEEQITIPSSGTRVTLSVSDEDWEATRSVYTSGDGIRLTNNEKIALLYDNEDETKPLYVGNSSYALASTPDGTGNHSFTAPDASLDKTWYGIVPYSKELTRANPNTKHLLITFPAIQFPGQNSFDPATDILVSKPFTIEGTGDKTASINAFKRLTAPFKLQITGLDPGDKIYAVTFDLSQTASSADLNTMAGRCNYTAGATPDEVNWSAVALPYTRSNAVSAVYDEGLEKVGDCWPIWFNVRPIKINSGKTMTVTVLTADACYTRTVNIKAGTFSTKKINSFSVDIKGSGYTEVPAISQGFFHNGMPAATSNYPTLSAQTKQLTATDNVTRDWEIKAFNWKASNLDGGSMLPDALGFPCRTEEARQGYIKLPAVAGKTITKVRLYLAPVSLPENKSFPLKVYKTVNGAEQLVYTVTNVTMLDLGQGYTRGGIIDIAPGEDMTGMTLKFEAQVNYNAYAALVSRIVLFTADAS